jgi:hypothetical protein
MTEASQEQIAALRRLAIAGQPEAAATRKCGRCGSGRIIDGRLTGVSGGAQFTPEEKRGRFPAWQLPIIDLRWRARAQLCVECGLLVAEVDSVTACEAIRRWGTDELKRRAGLNAPSELTPSDALAGRGDEPTP